MSFKEKVVVIVGCGFGGLSAARALKHFPGKVIVIDRLNHHLFQPLLYQVATSVLSPGQIAAPIRNILAGQPNTDVLLGEVTGVNVDVSEVIFRAPNSEPICIHFDYLVMATGVRLNYFGHEEFRHVAPGLKTLADAVYVRNRILQAFEAAEASSDPKEQKSFLTFVMVGGGPTGVEMAGALAVMVRSTLDGEFRGIDPKDTRIVLVDAGQRPLGSFDPSLSQQTIRRLNALGVEMRFGHRVERITTEGVIIDKEWIPSKTVIWTAGVTPSPAAKWLGLETDRIGRAKVQSDLSATGHPHIFVVGDTAYLEQDGVPLPGVAQVALQQGRYVANMIRSRSDGRPVPKPFRYFDKGNMAVVGKGFAVLQSGRVKLYGVLAWLVWAAVHIQFLSKVGLRISVLLQWMWTFFTNQRGSRLIVGPVDLSSVSQSQEYAPQPDR